MPLDADPDLLSFEHHLLAVKAFVAPWRERNRKGFVLEVVGVALHRAGEHAIRDIPRVDTVLHDETELLAPVLDGQDHLARQYFDRALPGHHGDHAHLRLDA